MSTSPAREPRGLSHARTSFVGRSEAVDKVAGLLTQYRLVTVTGPGGVGKTRLAGEVIRQVAGRFADGVWVAELAAVAEPAQVPATVATVLGLHQAAGVPIADALAARLARQQLLLVLDNCEHVLDAVAEFCATVLQSADDIRILATSREQLGLPEEARYRLPPLTLPGPSGPDGPGSAALPDQAEAVTLFVERARQLSPDLALDGEAGAVVARLVQRLDGMPLAIELAAARVEALGLGPMLDRLDDRFRLLVSANRAAPARQRSLDAAVDWSYPAGKGGRLADARAHLRDSAELAVNGGYPLRMIDILEHGGYLCAVTGRPAEAVTLWSARRTQCQAAGLAEPPQEERDRERPMAEARRALDARQFTAAQHPWTGSAIRAAAAVAPT